MSNNFKSDAWSVSLLDTSSNQTVAPKKEPKQVVKRLVKKFTTSDMKQSNEYGQGLGHIISQPFSINMDPPDI